MKVKISIAIISLVFIIFIAGCAKQQPREPLEQNNLPSTTIPGQAVVQQSSQQAIDSVIDAQLSQLMDQETDLAQLERELVL